MDPEGAFNRRREAAARQRCQRLSVVQVHTVNRGVPKRLSEGSDVIESGSGWDDDVTVGVGL
jgi:hypothetical protein